MNGPHFPFLSQNDGKFLRLITNFISLGEWELFSASIRELYKEERAQQKCLEMLAFLAENGPNPEW